jgi:acetyl-CoA carboxylase, biotin carboxylase subunit
VKLSGHAVECRLYAEDPANQFFPSPGKILSRRAPSGPGIRLDDGVYEGFTVSTEYDPMLAKLIAWGQDRTEAVARLRRALEEHSIAGVKTNTSLLLAILRDPEFLRADIYTRWLDERLPQFVGENVAPAADSVVEDAAVLTALLHTFGSSETAANSNGTQTEAESRWKRAARLEQVDRAE